MKKFIIFLIVILIIMVIVFILRPKQKLGAIPNSFNPAPSSSPIPTPREFQFDASTDLKSELDNIDPQVLESDFPEKD